MKGRRFFMKEKKKKMQLGIESHEFFDFLAQIQKVTTEHDDVKVDITPRLF